MAGVRLDRVLEALEAATDIWGKTFFAQKEEKLLYARQLHKFEHFSLPQIAKIVRINPRYVYEELTPGRAKGGRFDPATLSTLVRIRQAHLQGQKVPHQLVSMGIKGGTSYSCLTALTKIPYSAYYEVSVTANAELEQEALKGQTRIARSAEAQAKRVEKQSVISETREFFEMRKKEIFKLRESGLTTREIGRATGANHGYVSRVLRGER